MYKLMYRFGVFWPISGPVLDKLMAKREVERKCKMAPRVKERISTQIYQHCSTGDPIGSILYQLDPIYCPKTKHV